jgi:hypothetical protein
MCCSAWCCSAWVTLNSRGHQPTQRSFQPPPPPLACPRPQPLPPEAAARLATSTNAGGGSAGGAAGAPAAASPSAIAAQLTAAFGLPPDAANAAALKFAAADPALYASLWSNDADQATLEQLLQQASRSGGGSAGEAPPAPNGLLVHDYEFCGVELLKPTRMNKAYLVFAASILEQDLMFVVYNIPTVGICRAEQRVKACQKLGINYADLAHVEHMYVPPAVAQTAGVLGPTGRAAAAAAMEEDSDGDGGSGGGGGSAAAGAAAAGGGGGGRRKRTASQQAAAGGDALIGAEGLAHAAQHAAPTGVVPQQQMLDAMLNMVGAQGLSGLGGAPIGLPGIAGLPGLHPMQAMPLGAGGFGAFPGAPPPASAGLALGQQHGGSGGGGAPALDMQQMGSLNVEAMLAEMDGMINAAAAAAAAAGANGAPAGSAWAGGGSTALPHSRMALRGARRRLWGKGGTKRAPHLVRG